VRARLDFMKENNDLPQLDHADGSARRMDLCCRPRPTRCALRAAFGRLSRAPMCSGALPFVHMSVGDGPGLDMVIFSHS